MLRYMVWMMEEGKLVISSQSSNDLMLFLVP